MNVQTHSEHIKKVKFSWVKDVRMPEKALNYQNRERENRKQLSEKTEKSCRNYNMQQPNPEHMVVMFMSNMYVKPIYEFIGTTASYLHVVP